MTLKLGQDELEKIVDRLENFRDRLRMHQHLVALRLEEEERQRAAAQAPQPSSGSEAEQILVWLRGEFLAGRQGTVRGDFGLKIAQLIEQGAWKSPPVTKKEAV